MHLSLLNCVLNAAMCGGRGEEKNWLYKHPSSDVLAKARRIFAFPLPYYYSDSPWTAVQSFTQSLRQQTCHQLMSSAPRKTVKGLKVSPVIVTITINYLFTAHWNHKTPSTYKIMFLSAAGADFQVLNCLFWLRRQLRQPSGDAGRSIPGSPAPWLSHCLQTWQKQVFPLTGSHRLCGWHGLLCWVHVLPEIQRRHLCLTHRPDQNQRHTSFPVLHWHVCKTN